MYDFIKEKRNLTLIFYLKNKLFWTFFAQIIL